MSRSLVAESCPNGAIDPGETNTVSFVIKNDTDNVYEEVQVRLRPNAGNVDFVLDPLTAKQTVDKKASITVQFRFRAKGGCGEDLTPILDVVSKDGLGNSPEGGIVFSGDLKFQLGLTVNTQYTFAGGVINLKDLNADNAQGKADPYPSTVTVAGVPNQTGFPGERLSKVTVTLRGLNHGSTPQLTVVLQSPWGQNILLMRKVGLAQVNDLTFTIDSTAGSLLPQNSPLLSGTFKPADYNALNPSPTIPDLGIVTDTDLGHLAISKADAEASTVTRTPNGQWKLYIQDTQNGDSGTLAGWDLQLTTSKVVCCGGGDTFPIITQNGEPGIGNVEIFEDTLFVDHDPAPATSPNDLRSPVVAFNVADLESTGGNLSVSAASSDQSKIKNSNLRIKAPNANGRTIEFQPEPNANGDVTITVTVTDQSGRSGTASFNLKIKSVNDLPSVSDIRGVKVPQGTSTAPIPFTVGDVETQPDFLIPTAVSSDENVVPSGNVFFGGSGANRTVQVFPKTLGPTGTSSLADITVKVTDLDGGFTTKTFRVDFSLTAGQPTITPLPNTSTDEDTAKDIGFSISSTVGNSADSLQITRSSSNQTLLPTANITISGSGTERTIHIIPSQNQNSSNSGTPGTSDVTITVLDPSNSKSTSTTFTVTVNPKNDAPTISSISDQTINEDSDTGALAFTVGDVETPVGSLIVTATSSNGALVRDVASGDITLGGSGADRTIKIKPLANAFGRTTISVFVADTGDGGDASKTTGISFVVTVNPANDQPIILQVQGPSNAGQVDFNTAKNLADNDTDAPELVRINEDANDQFVEGNVDKGVIELSMQLLGISAGAGDEREQTVSIVASVDRSDLISSIRFDTEHGKDKVKWPTTSTTMLFTPVHNASGTVVVTLVLTDNGVGGTGNSVLSTIRKFKITIMPVNDAPNLVDPGDKTLPRKNPSVIPIEISDVETARQFIEVTAVSDNESVVKSLNILVDPNRTFLTITPEDVTSGSANITVTIKDKGATNTETDSAPADVKPKTDAESFLVTVANILPPSISLTRAVDVINEDTPANNTITLGDNKSVAIDQMTVTATSDNPVLIPNGNILIGPVTDLTGAAIPPGQVVGGTRQLAVVPAQNESGTARITIRAVDNEGLSVITTYGLTVLPVEDPPSVSLVISTASDTKWTDVAHAFPGGLGGLSGSTPVLNTIENANPVADPKTASGLPEITVSDPETPASNIIVTVSSKVPGTSDDSPVLPKANITVSNTGSTRTLTMIPAAGKNGQALVTVIDTDSAGLTGSKQFVVNVQQVNNAPTVDQIGNMNIDEDAPEFTVHLTHISPGPDEANQGQHITSLKAEATDKGSDPAVNNLVDITQDGSTTGTPYTSGDTFDIKIKPRANAFGTSTITVTLKDNGLVRPNTDDKDTGTMKFDVTIREINDTPIVSFTAPPATVSTSVDAATTQGTPTQVIPFYVSDVETAVTALQITAQSSNPTLVPNDAAHLQVGGSGNNRGIIILPANNQFGTANIAITVTDSGRKSDGSDVRTAAAVIHLSVTAGQAPIISTIPNQSIHVNEYSDIIFFTVNDAQTPADQLQVSLVSSSNRSLIPELPSNVQFGGSGTSRALIIKPVDNQSGSSELTIQVKDFDQNVTTTKFTVNVLGNPPTISQVSNPAPIGSGGTTAPLPFTVFDKETFPGFLIVTGKSSNQAVVSDNNIFVLGATANRTVSILAGQTGGTATITLTVKDGEGQTATTSFDVTVSDNNLAPTITSVGNQNTSVGTPTGIISFVVGDDSTPAANLVVTAASSNTTLVPNTADALKLLVGGTPANRGIVITPAAGKTGTAQITLTVTDAGGKTANTSFALTVNAVSTVPNDFNGDGAPDILFQQDLGFMAAWYMSGTDAIGTTFLTPDNVGDAKWKIVDSGDVDGDGHPDILFQHADGSLAVWIMNGVRRTSSQFTSPSNAGGSSWKAIALADFDGDKKLDILFQHTSGDLGVWYMNGLNLKSVAMLSPANPGDAGWKAVGTGDFNNDGLTDIVFQHTDGTLGVWYMNGVNLILPGLFTPSSAGDINWRVVGTTDQNGDGKTDLLFQHTGNSDLAVWFMNGPKLVLGHLLNPSNPGAGTWRIMAP